jgi:hypothetical protein
VPLIIPCHRVILRDGKIGGFSAGGGPQLKKRMLELEARGTELQSCKGTKFVVRRKD